MKKLILVAFLISSLNIFSEEYICSIVWDGQVQTYTFLREGNEFIYTHWVGAKEKMNIIATECFESSNARRSFLIVSHIICLFLGPWLKEQMMKVLKRNP